MKTPLISKKFNYNKNDIDTSFTVNMYELEEHYGHNFKIETSFKDISLLKDNSFKRFFIDSVLEDVLEEALETNKFDKSKTHMLVPSFAEITNSEGSFLDCYYENVFDEDRFLTGDGEIGKCIVSFDDLTDKNQLIFDLSAIYCYDEHGDEYDVFSYLINDFNELLLENIH